MKKRAVVVMLALAVGMMTGCASKNNTKETVAETQKVTEAAAEEAVAEETPAEETAAAEEETVAAEEETVAAEAESEDAEAESETEGFAEAEAETEEMTIQLASYEPLDYVELGTYTNMDIEVAPAGNVTDEEVSARIQDEVAAGNYVNEVKEGTVKDGDTVNIDFVGKLDGEAFAGGTAEGYDLVIGSKSFIDGFEDGLIGKEIGSTVTLDLTFPEDYMSADLAGKETQFDVTINFVSEQRELDDALVEEMTGGEYKTIADYSAFIRQTLTEEKEATAEGMKKSLVYTKAAEAMNITGYPEELVNQMVDMNIEQMEAYATMYGMTLDDFCQAQLQMDLETAKEYIKTQVEYSLETEMILRSIAEAEGIDATEEEIREMVEPYVSQIGVATVEEALEYFGEERVKIAVIEDKAIEWLVEHNNFIEIQETEMESESEVQTEAETELETEA